MALPLSGVGVAQYIRDILNLAILSTLSRDQSDNNAFDSEKEPQEVLLMCYAKWKWALLIGFK